MGMGVKPGAAVICMHDRFLDPPAFPGCQSVPTLQVCVGDITEPIGNSSVPTPEIARKIWEFWLQYKDRISEIIIQDEKGIGCAAAVAICIGEMTGNAAFAKENKRKGTYNILMYKLLRAAAGSPVQNEPKVDIIIRVSWPVDRLQALLLSLKRQRYTNWRAFVLTDGKNDEVRQLLAQQPVTSNEVKLLETPQQLGHWGFPWFQTGINACTGDIIGIQNDDNYLTPGFIEQLVWDIEDGASVAMCNFSHNYFGYGLYNADPRQGYCDLGCFLARADLMKQVPWPGQHSEADGQFIQRLVQVAGMHRIAKTNKVLFVHN
jgi:hypothetical protein